MPSATPTHASRLRAAVGAAGLLALVAAAVALPQVLSRSTSEKLDVLTAAAAAAEATVPEEAPAEVEAAPVTLVLAQGEDANSSAAGLAALTAAFTQAGKPYEWGGTGPDTWDCSGLVQWAFGQAGVALPRVSEDQALSGEPIAEFDMAPGDVITFRDAADHVGIYAGGGLVFNAYDESVPIGLTPLAELPPIHNVQRFY